MEGCSSDSYPDHQYRRGGHGVFRLEGHRPCAGPEGIVSNPWLQHGGVQYSAADQGPDQCHQYGWHRMAAGEVGARGENVVLAERAGGVLDRQPPGGRPPENQGSPGHPGQGFEGHHDPLWRGPGERGGLGRPGRLRAGAPWFLGGYRPDRKSVV